MATIELRVDDFEDGVLPRTCASSGAPADGLYRLRATRSAAWPVVLLVFGPIGAVATVVLLVLLHGHVDGWLPMSDQAHAAVRAARRAAVRRLVEVVVAVAGIVALLAWQGWTTALVVVVLAGAVSVGFCVATVFQPPGSLGLRWARNGRIVTVKDASDEFVAAYREQEARRVRRRAAEVADSQR